MVVFSATCVSGPHPLIMASSAASGVDPCKRGCSERICTARSGSSRDAIHAHSIAAHAIRECVCFCARVTVAPWQGR